MDSHVAFRSIEYPIKANTTIIKNLKGEGATGNIKEIQSDIADLNHAADKGDYSAGSVTAALYLEHFVGDSRWVHLDIAGTGRSETDSGENVKGGTGFGVRLFLDWIVSLS